MAKRKRTKAKTAEAPPPDGADDFSSLIPSESQIFTGGASLHNLFSQQTRTLLDESDLDEESKQSILVALSCPCCGTSGMSYSVKLKRRT